MVTLALSLRSQLEQTLRDQGRLPVGGHLALLDAYLGASGSGELFVDADALPRRQVLQLRLPASASGEAVEGTIAADYSDFAPAPFGVGPLRSLAVLPWAPIAHGLGLLLGSGAVCAIAFADRSRRVRGAFAVLGSLRLMALPLLQAQPAAAARAAAPHSSCGCSRVHPPSLPCPWGPSCRPAARRR